MPKAPKPPPASPPKRMTRARAKAVEEKQQTQVITTAGAKAAVGPSKTAKRKTRTDDEPSENNATQKASSAAAKKQPAKSQPKRTTKSKPEAIKDNTSEEQEDELAIQPQTRSRGRPNIGQQTSKSSSTKSVTTTRATRGQAPPKQQAQTSTKIATTRKKVAFQDEQEAEKENVVDISSNPQSDKKPIKKSPAALSQAPQRGRGAAVVRGSKSNNSKSRTDDGKRGEPLSPKKASQVAKAAPKETTEETSAAMLSKSPCKLPVQSPKKQTTPAPTRRQDESHFSAVEEEEEEDPAMSVDELELPGQGSPVKRPQGTLAGSPAKRPPQSPTKVSLKDSPKKFNLGTPTSKTPSGSTLSIQASASLVKSPARRPPSPIKLFRDGADQAVQQTPTSTMKTSLLQSPAKRPPSSVKPLYFPPSTQKPLSTDNKPSLIASTLSQSPQKFKMPIAATPSKTPQELTHSASPAKLPETYTEEKSPNPAEDGPNTLPPNSPEVDAPIEASAVLQIGRAEPNENALPEVDMFGSPSQESAQQTCQSTPNTERGSIDLVQAQDPAFTTTLELDDRTMPLGVSPEPWHMQSHQVQWSPAEDSEDELMSDDPRYCASPSRKTASDIHRTRLSNAATPITKNAHPDTLSMTGLAERFEAWTRATPDPQILEQRNMDGFVFSPVKPHSNTAPIDVEEPRANAQPTDSQSNSFGEAMEIHEDKDDSLQDELNVPQDMFRQSYTSETSQEYGDENEVPIDPVLLETKPQMAPTCTPQRVERKEPQVIHTVSKVPLKPAGDIGISPMTKANATKRHSVAPALTPRGDVDLQALRQIYPPAKQVGPTATGSGLCTPSKAEAISEEAKTFTPTVKSTSMSNAGTPARTPRADLNKKLLNGAVVFVDVHTSEGADASGIFVDLLQQMGATVRSSWNWNPEKNEESDTTETDSRPGITHVVFKDGGKRTMEKVRMTNGVVFCVGVGWVLE